MSQVNAEKNLAGAESESPLDALASCPFCGKQPTLRCFPNRAPDEIYELACDNPDCTVRVELYAHTADAATQRWNTRRSAWQPIDSAPKDGTYVLVAGDSGYTTTPLRVEVCRFDPEYRPLSPWVNHANDCFTEGGDDPMYWMPLPTPPKEMKDE